MSQKQYANGAEACDAQPNSNTQPVSLDVLEQEFTVLDPDLDTLEHNGVVARGPHIVLTCGPYDEDEEEGNKE